MGYTHKVCGRYVNLKVLSSSCSNKTKKILTYCLIMEYISCLKILQFND